MPPASATPARALSDDELAERAHTIVVGRATARTTVWVGRDLVTLVTVAVAESLKGEAGTTLTVALPGGIDRQRKIPIEVIYVGAPHIARGEEVLLFLERGGRMILGTYVVSGLARGKRSITSDSAGVKWISRGATPIPEASAVHVHANQTVGGIDIVTNRTIDVNGFGRLDFLSLAALEDPSGIIHLPYLAVRIPGARLAEVTRSSAVPILSALFLTAPFDPSAVQPFPEAMLTTGAVRSDGTAWVDLAR